MKAGIAAEVTITNPGYLVDAAEDITGKRESVDISLAAVFKKSQTSGSFKIEILEVEGGAGSSRKLNILAKILNEKDLLEDATSAYHTLGGDRAKTVDSKAMAVYILTMLSNSNEAPDQLGVRVDRPIGLSPSEIRRIIERNSEPSLSR
jgi:hypothetical protein